MLVALSAQRHPLRFQHFVHARQARSDHRVVQRFADHARQMQPQLSPRGFLSILALGTLVHGGLLLLPNPIFRSGEECRHSNLNNLQDIAAQSSSSSPINLSILMEPDSDVFDVKTPFGCFEIPRKTLRNSYPSVDQIKKDLMAGWVAKWCGFFPRT